MADWWRDVLQGVGIGLIGYALGPQTARAAWGAFFAGSMAAYSSHEARVQQQRARDAVNNSYVDRMQTFRASDAPRRIIYGRARVSGPVAYNKSWGDKKQNLTVVIPLAGHAIDAVEDVYLDDTHLITAPDGWTLPGSGKYFKEREDTRTVTVPLPLSTAGVTITDPEGHKILGIESIAVPGDVNPDTGQPVYFRLNADFNYTIPGDTTATIHGNGDPDMDQWAGIDAVVTYRILAGTALVRVKWWRGDEGGDAFRDLDLEAHSDGEWTSAHLGQLVARIVVTMVYDQEVFGQSGMPNITVVLRGKRVYNVTTGATEWTNNAALCALDFLMDTRYGFGVPLAKINAAEWQTTQQRCATDAYPLTCNGMLSSDTDRKENLAAILACMGGIVFKSSGKWIGRCLGYDAPVMTLTDADLSDRGGDFVLGPKVPRRDRYNSVRGTFANPAKLYQNDDFPPYPSAPDAPRTYQLQDGEPIWHDVALPLVTNAMQAQRLAKVELYQHRNPFTFAASWKLRAYQLEPGDRVFVKIDRYGWSALNGGQGKIFRVRKFAMTVDCNVRLELQEDAAAIWAFDYNEAVTPDPTPNTAFPDPSKIDAPEGFSVYSSASSYAVVDGLTRPFVRCSWQQVTDKSVISGGAIVLQFKDASASEYTTMRLRGDAVTYDIPVTRGQVLNIRFWAETPLGSSPIIIATHTASPNLPTAGASALTVSGNLLMNATARVDAKHWTGSPGGVTGEIHFGKPDASTGLIPGSPSNLYIWTPSSSENARPFLLSDPVTTRGTARYACMCYHVSQNCDSDFAIRWEDATGAHIDTVYFSTAGGGAPRYGARGQYAGAGGELVNYLRRHFFARAPQNAAQARMVLIKGAPDAFATNSIAWFMKMFLGEVTEDANTAPAWDAGQQGETTTLQVGAGQITGLAVAGDGGVASVTEGTMGIGGTGTPEFKSPRDGTAVIVSAHANCSVLRVNAAQATKGTFGLYLEININGSGWQRGLPAPNASPYSSENSVRDLAIGGAKDVSLVIPAAMFYISKGQTFQFRPVLDFRDVGVRATNVTNFGAEGQLILA